MKRIYTWAAKPANRTLTVDTLIKSKGKIKYNQVTANNAMEAYAAEQAGFDMVICGASNVDKVREGTKKLFLTAALELHNYITADEVLRGAFTVLSKGADAVMTPRSMEIVSMLAKEDVPVMGHLGLVPRKSTWIGGLRAVGKTSKEAIDLYKKFKRLEDAGAFSAECEVIPENVMKEISKKINIVTVSLGSGKFADVDYLFMEDICGETESPPKHAKAFGNILRLKKQIEEERLKALKSFKKAVKKGSFPSYINSTQLKKKEFNKFLEFLSK